MSAAPTSRPPLEPPTIASRSRDGAALRRPASRPRRGSRRTRAACCSRRPAWCQASPCSKPPRSPAIARHAAGRAPGDEVGHPRRRLGDGEAAVAGEDQRRRTAIGVTSARCIDEQADRRAVERRVGECARRRGRARRRSAGGGGHHRCRPSASRRCTAGGASNVASDDERRGARRIGVERLHGDEPEVADDRSAACRRAPTPRSCRPPSVEDTTSTSSPRLTSAAEHDVALGDDRAPRRADVERRRDDPAVRRVARGDADQLIAEEDERRLRLDAGRRRRATRPARRRAACASIRPQPTMHVDEQVAAVGARRSRRATTRRVGKSSSTTGRRPDRRRAVEADVAVVLVAGGIAGVPEARAVGQPGDRGGARVGDRVGERLAGGDVAARAARCPRCRPRTGRRRRATRRATDGTSRSPPRRRRRASTGSSSTARRPSGRSADRTIRTNWSAPCGARRRTACRTAHRSPTAPSAAAVSAARRSCHRLRLGRASSASRVRSLWAATHVGDLGRVAVFEPPVRVGDGHAVETSWSSPRRVGGARGDRGSATSHVGPLAVVGLRAAHLRLLLLGLLRHGRPGYPSGGAGPLEQVVGRPGVDHPVERHVALGGPVAAVRLPLQLAGGVGVGVDREVAAVVDGQLRAAAAAGRAARDGS